MKIFAALGGAILALSSQGVAIAASEPIEVGIGASQYEAELSIDRPWIEVIRADSVAIKFNNTSIYTLELEFVSNGERVKKRVANRTDVTVSVDVPSSINIRYVYGLAYGGGTYRDCQLEPSFPRYPRGTDCKSVTTGIAVTDVEPMLYCEGKLESTQVELNVVEVPGAPAYRSFDAILKLNNWTYNPRAVRPFHNRQDGSYGYQNKDEGFNLIIKADQASAETAPWVPGVLWLQAGLLEGFEWKEIPVTCNTKP